MEESGMDKRGMVSFLVEGLVEGGPNTVLSPMLHIVALLAIGR